MVALAFVFGDVGGALGERSCGANGFANNRGGDLKPAGPIMPRSLDASPPARRSGLFGDRRPAGGGEVAKPPEEGPLVRGGTGASCFVSIRGKIGVAFVRKIRFDELVRQDWQSRGIHTTC